jgi:hypothetical protein
LLTDGDIEKIHKVRKLLLEHSGINNMFRIFTLGIGRDANRILLEEVAKIGNGICKMIVDSKDLSQTITTILEYSSSQYYANAKHSMTDEIMTIYPNRYVSSFLCLTEDQFKEVQKFGMSISGIEPIFDT